MKKNKKKKASIVLKSVLILFTVAGFIPAGATNLFDSPAGFLVPTEEAVPEGYTMFGRINPNRVKKSAEYGCQFDRWVTQIPSINKKVDLGNGVIGTTGVIGEGGRARDSQIFYSECIPSPPDSYESRIDYFNHDKLCTKLQDFTFEGFPGAVYKTTNFYQRERETYDLLWKDGNRILKIVLVYEQKQPNFNSNSLIAMLTKFQRLK